MGDLFLLLLLAILCQGGAGQITNTPTDPTTTITSTVPTTTTDLSTTGPPGDDDLPQDGEDCSNVPNLPERWRSSDGLCCRCCYGITRCRRRRECETELEVTPNCVSREFSNGNWWICVERRCVLQQIFGNRRRLFGSSRGGWGGRRPFDVRGRFCVEDNGGGGGGGGEATTPRTGEAPPLPDRSIRGDEDDRIDDGLLEEDEETDSGWPGRRRDWPGRRRGGGGVRRGGRVRRREWPGGRWSTPSIRWF